MPDESATETQNLQLDVPTQSETTHPDTEAERRPSLGRFYPVEAFPEDAHEGGDG
jgi:hypothetical protein